LAQLDSITAHPTVRQFLKFCIIGLSSMMIDIGLLYALYKKLGMHWVPAQTISFTFAASNGFVWNSLWTFRGLGSGARHIQYARFVAFSFVGYLLNLGIIQGVLSAFTAGQPDKHTEIHFALAKGVAIVCVAFWNFFSNKKWTFTTPKPEEN